MSSGICEPDDDDEEEDEDAPSLSMSNIECGSVAVVAVVAADSKLSWGSRCSGLL